MSKPIVPAPSRSTPSEGSAQPQAVLDTSGRVAGDVGGLAVWYEWDDLDPFTQGYIEAMFAGFNSAADCQACRGSGKTIGRSHAFSIEPCGRCGGTCEPIDACFSDFAHETLVRIMAECERVRRAPGLSSKPLDYSSVTAGEGARSLGRTFWTYRQYGHLADFPPLTPYLGDDGLVFYIATDKAEGRP